MTDEKDRKEENNEVKKEKEDWPLPNCTKAPSAEHFRANAEDEPCDDARGTVIDDTEDKA